VPGIGLQLTINPAMRGFDVNPGDQQAGAYVSGYITGTSGSLVVTYTAQLVVTGTVTPGTVGALTLFNYEWYIFGDTNSVSLGTHMTLNSGTQVTLQGCTVNTSSQNFTVTLPTISTHGFTATGSTAGETGFNINLACQTGTTVFVTMATANANATAGVINPTTGTGFATNVGVQLLNGSQTPITFNTAQNVGASPNGTLAVPYFARYYQTGTTVTAGQVSATATFTMSYQ
jgi:type 1 fimbria pilin